MHLFPQNPTIAMPQISHYKAIVTPESTMLLRAIVDISNRNMHIRHYIPSPLLPLHPINMSSGMSFAFFLADEAATAELFFFLITGMAASRCGPDATWAMGLGGRGRIPMRKMQVDKCFGTGMAV